MVLTSVASTGSVYRSQPPLIDQNIDSTARARSGRTCRVSARHARLKVTIWVTAWRPIASETDRFRDGFNLAPDMKQRAFFFGPSRQLSPATCAGAGPAWVIRRPRERERERERSPETGCQSPCSSPDLARPQDIVSDLYRLAIVRFVLATRWYRRRGVLCARCNTSGARRSAARLNGSTRGWRHTGVTLRRRRAVMNARYVAVVVSRRVRQKRPAEAAAERRGTAPDRAARRREKSLSTAGRRRRPVFYRGHAQCAWGGASCTDATCARAKHRASRRAAKNIHNWTNLAH